MVVCPIKVLKVLRYCWHFQDNKTKLLLPQNPNSVLVVYIEIIFPHLTTLAEKVCSKDDVDTVEVTTCIV